VCVCVCHSMLLIAVQYVDEVLIGAPYEVTQALLDDLNISVVAHGSTEIVTMPDGTDPYQHARNAGE
jgi:ethanolamine-phosphate cytidylyltransferase